MSKKKEDNEQLKELRAKLQENQAVIGTERVLKQLQTGKLNKILLASNCPLETKENITRQAKLIGIDVVELSQDNEELGIFCKKSFFVAVVGIK